MRVIYTDTAELATQEWEDSIVMVMPFTDLALSVRSSVFAAKRAGISGTILAVHDIDRRGFIATANLAFKRTKSPLFGYMAQDAYAGRSWMYNACESFADPKISLLGFNDGKWHGYLAAFGLARRAWAAENYPSADLFHPQYQCHYADTELTVLARAVGGYAYNPLSVLVEVDWEKETKSVNIDDRNLYRARAAASFDGMVTDPKILGLFA